MPNQTKSKANSIPDLSGLISKEDLHKKGSFATYMNWARTTQYLREHAPGWAFYLAAKNEEYVWPAPDGSGYLMCFFENGEIRTPLFPFPIMDNRNNPIPLERISARDVSDSHRRGLCACSAFVFGLAYELWARIEVEEAAKSDELEAKSTPKVTSTPKRATPAKKAATNIIAAATPSSNDPERKATEDERSRIKGQVTEFLKTHGDNWPSIVTHFNQEFDKDGDKIFENVTQLKHCLFLAEKMTGIINASR
jgi:hypothetical protein